MGASVFASVVFLKVQEFARRAASEQARLRAQLEAVVAVVTAEIDPAARIVLDASDGVAIVVLRDPQAALRLGERALSAAAAGLPLSAGINHGAVQPSGEKGARGMAGDGIAVAAAAAEFASPSRLLASRAFRDALADAAPGREALLARAETFSDPGLRAYELFGLDPRAERRRRRFYAVASVLAFAILLGGGIGMRVAKDGRQAFADSLAAKSQHYWSLLVHKVRN
jgi:hypothetical protein